MDCILCFYHTQQEVCSCKWVQRSPVIGVHHMCQQSRGEEPACGLPHPPAAEPPLQLAVCVAQAEARQHTHCSITLEPETLNLQEASAHVYAGKHTSEFPVVCLFQGSCTADTDFSGAKKLNCSWNAVCKYKHFFLDHKKLN